MCVCQLSVLLALKVFLSALMTCATRYSDINCEKDGCANRAMVESGNVSDANPLTALMMGSIPAHVIWWWLWNVENKSVAKP